MTAAAHRVALVVREGLWSRGLHCIRREIFDRLTVFFLVQICASILGNEWSPVLSVVAVCVTIQSMLASCKVCPVQWLVAYIYPRRSVERLLTLCSNE